MTGNCGQYVCESCSLNVFACPGKAFYIRGGLKNEVRRDRI
jgi:hypothetical protein